jgi:hypothetical protein
MKIPVIPNSIIKRKKRHRPPTQKELEEKAWNDRLVRVF